MTRSELKQLIRETIEEYKSKDTEFWRRAAEKAKEKSDERGGETAKAQADRFAKKASDVAMGSGAKKFKIQIYSEFRIHNYEGQIELTNLEDQGDKFVIKFKKLEDYTGDEFGYLIIYKASKFDGDMIGMVNDQGYRNSSVIYNNKDTYVRFDRNGAISLSKISGIPVKEFPLL